MGRISTGAHQALLADDEQREIRSILQQIPPPNMHEGNIMSFHVSMHLAR
jgi:hypothetical protein